MAAGLSRRVCARFARPSIALAVWVVMALAAITQANAPLAAAPAPIWIDTDAACGSSDLADAGACWALALAMRSPNVVVRGISTVSGRVKAGQAGLIAAGAAKRFGYSGAVHQGAMRQAYRPTAGSRAMAAALQKERLTIVALGPLTNIAALLLTQPKSMPRIERVVVIFGQPPEITKADNLTDFRDANAATDTKAVAAVMRTAVDLTIIPIDAGRSAMVTAADLDGMVNSDDNARWLAGVSRGWLEHWRTLRQESGAFPAASVAVAAVSHGELLTCRKTKAQFAWKHSFFRERSALEIGDNVAGGRPITYCGAIKPEFHEVLLKAISGPAR